MLAFVSQFITNFKTTGAVLPSGGVLARAMTRSARRADGPRRILEVGPGTGAFTRHLLRSLRSGDELHIVEINRKFADYLERKLLSDYRRRNPEIDVMLHCTSIQDASVQGLFDYIVCGLPFNNFSGDLVRSIFRRMMRLLAEDGQLTFFEYAGVRMIKAPIVGSDGRRKMRKHQAIMKVLQRRHCCQSDLVLANVPPAYAHHLKR